MQLVLRACDLNQARVRVTVTVMYKYQNIIQKRLFVRSGNFLPSEASANFTGRPTERVP